MARYINLDKVIKDLQETIKDKNPNELAYTVFNLFIERLDKEPIEDVVPRALYESLKNENIETIKAIVDGRRAYAREIFEEIEKIMWQPMGEPCGGLMQFENMRSIAELKKKYTVQSCNDCANQDGCEKATHIENYRITGCANSKSKEDKNEQKEN